MEFVKGRQQVRAVQPAIVIRFAIAANEPIRFTGMHSGSGFRSDRHGERRVGAPHEKDY
jgi:hypothetical protein